MVVMTNYGTVEPAPTWPLFSINTILLDVAWFLLFAILMNGENLKANLLADILRLQNEVLSTLRDPNSVPQHAEVDRRYAELSKRYKVRRAGRFVVIEGGVSAKPDRGAVG